MFGYIVQYEVEKCGRDCHCTYTHVGWVLIERGFLSSVVHNQKNLMFVYCKFVSNLIFMSTQ